MRGEPNPDVVEIPDFHGLATGLDAHDLPPGAAVEQVNATCVDAGQLQSRDGFRVIQFEG